MNESEIFDVLNQAYFSADCHEKQVIDHLPELLAGVEVFVDIGASLGQYVFHANKILRGGEILAVEADPIRFPELSRNCTTWQSKGHNTVTAVHAAVADVAGTITFHSTGSDVSGGLFRHPVARSGVEWTEISVPSLTLDNLLRDHAPDVIKIDIEGAEMRALEGAQELLRNGQAKWLIEIHGWSDPEVGGGSDQIYSHMASHGYHHVIFHGQDLFVREQPSFAALGRGTMRRIARRLARWVKGLARSRGGRATGD